LIPGWNWISFSPQEPQAIEYALGELGSSADVIKNQSGFSYFYEGAGWFGSLDMLNPGEGYKLKMLDGVDFHYPLPEETTSRSVKVTRSNNTPNIRGFDYHKYQYSGSLVLSSKNPIKEGSVIIAKHDNEIRGISQILDYKEALGKRYYSLMVYSNAEYEENFELYYQEDEKSAEYKLDHSFDFENDLLLGDFMEPVILNLTNNEGEETPQYHYDLRSYPNPFNPETIINYELAKPGQVNIDVYNIKCQKVRNLVNEVKEAGKYSIVWNADDYNSGIYFGK